MREKKGRKIEFEEVESLMYVSVLTDNSCLVEKEIKLRIDEATNCARSPE